LAATLEHNGNPVLITDVEGRLILLNQQARERLALTGKAIGRPAAEVIAQPELAMMLSHPPHHEVGVQRREVELGEDTFYLCTLAPIPGYGQILVLQDVSYLKELDTVKSNFVATVSHDLRAPLNSIMGFASTLSQVGPLTKEQVKFVQRINASAQRMSNLVTSLLDLARVDSRLEQSRELCDVVALAKSVLTDLQGRALTKEIALVLDVEGSPAPVVGDPAQIRQAITNLVDNAIKYSPAGHAVRVALETQSDTLLVKVYDQGPGISSRDISHIFDRFYRGKDKKYQLEHGSGLGLTLVRSIAEAHGGWVWVESEPEKGSTFTLQLPLVREEERAHTVGADG
jgi:signal transduction histidine kinase